MLTRSKQSGAKTRRPDPAARAVPAVHAPREDDVRPVDPAPGPQRTALTITDDASLAETIADILQDGSFHVRRSDGIKEAILAVTQEAPHLVVVEAGCMGHDFHDLVRRIRRVSGVPVLAVVPDADTGADCLEAGADDYLYLPLQPRELIARANRRAQQPNGHHPVLTFGTLVIDSVGRRVSHSGEVLDLSTLEFDLLAHLAAHPRVSFTREDLLTEVWRSSSAWQGRKTVTEHIYRLRRKLQRDPDGPQWITTVRGKGYRFDPADANASATS